MNPSSWSVTDYDFILSSQVRNSLSCLGQVLSYLMVYIDFFVQLAENIGRFHRTCKSYEGQTPPTVLALSFSRGERDDYLKMEHIRSVLFTKHVNVRKGLDRCQEVEQG
jgi:hypothetical protein